ncbi:AraC family transcriptional regulator [Actinomycetes bacterium KLBMP 9759]
MEALLRGIRSHEGTLQAVRLAPGEEVAVPVTAPLVLCAVVSGGATAVGASMRPGSVAIVQPGPALVLRADDAGASLLVCGYRAWDGGIRLTSALPPVAVVDAHDPDCVTLLELLGRQIRSTGSGIVVQDRLLDWLLTCTLHAWFTDGGPDRPAWFAALSDPVVGPALAAMHADPARRWTVEELAARGGSGRAAFARRFRETVGCAPLAYLRDWRMTLAAEYLADPDLTVGAVAHRVGYADAFTFSTAFKRERGMAPSAARA